MTLQERLIKYMTDNGLPVITTAKLLGIGPTPVTLIKLKNKYTPATAEKIYNALGPDYLEYVEYSVCECCGTKYIPRSTLQKTCENTDCKKKHQAATRKMYFEKVAAGEHVVKPHREWRSRPKKYEPVKPAQSIPEFMGGKSYGERQREHLIEIQKGQRMVIR